MLTIGIDIGTSYSSVAILNKNGFAEPVKVSNGVCVFGDSHSMPSAAYVENNGNILIGQLAMSSKMRDPSRFKGEFKRDLGKTIPYNIGSLQLMPEDLYKEMFIHFKEHAEKAGGEKIKKAYITYPANYGKKKRKLIEMTAKKAGLLDVVLIDEPTAAAYCYCSKGKIKEGDKLLVYDFGGGTFDVALIQYTNQGFKPITEALGIEKCGGIDIDRMIFKDVINSIPKEIIENIKSNGIAYKRFKAQIMELSVKIKHQLTSTDSYKEAIPVGFEYIDYEISCEKLNKIIEPLVEETIVQVRNIVKNANLKMKDINVILMVGGTSRIPYIQGKLKQLTGKTIYYDIDPELAVCMGAALWKQDTPPIEHDIKPIQNDIGTDVKHYKNKEYEQLSKKVEQIKEVGVREKIKETKIINPKVYEEKRNELMLLLEKIIKIKELDKDTRVKISKILKKSVENNFEIVLVGEFQGGKSTTFNAICDGREISPRGAMIKTSACKISALNISDPNIAENAEIKWKSEKDILKGIIDIIDIHLKKLDFKRFVSATREQMISISNDSRPLDMSDDKDIRLIKKALNSEWEEYKKNKSNYDINKLDGLRIASLMIEYLKSPDIISLRKKKQISIYDISKLVTFPIDWQKRWENCDPKKFKAEEIAFTFLSEVKCYIHSNNLSRLGCVITDCPGLFTSMWDTEVAKKAMLDADAILYLIGGEKVIGQGDVRALKQVRSIGMEHKLFYSINVKGKIKNIKRNILPENIAKLRSHGFEVTESELHLYHAVLGLCSKNGSFIMNRIFDEHSQNQFISVAKRIDPDYSDDIFETWAEVSDDMITNIDRKESIEFLDAESIEKVTKYSGLDNLFTKIEQTVISKKARSILIDKGAKQASKALALLENDLKSKEEIAQKTEAEFRIAVQKSRKELELFQKKAVEIIKELDDEENLFALAENYEKIIIFESIPEISEKATRTIIDQVFTFKQIIKNLKPENLNKVIQPILEQSMKSVFEMKTEGWLENIKSGNNWIFNVAIAKLVKDISKKIGEEWEKTIADDSDYVGLLNGLQISEPVGDIAMDAEIFSNFISKGIYGDINIAGIKVLLGALVGGITAIITAAIIGTVTFTIISTIPVVLGLGTLSLAGEAGECVTSGMTSGAKKKLKSKIEESLKSAFYESQDKMRVNSLEAVKNLQQIYVRYFQCSLQEQESVFNKRVEERTRDFEQSEQEREQLAMKCQEIRCKKISPAKKSIDEFCKSVEILLNNNKMG